MSNFTNLSGVIQKPRQIGTQICLKRKLLVFRILLKFSQTEHYCKAFELYGRFIFFMLVQWLGGKR